MVVALFIILHDANQGILNAKIKVFSRGITITQSGNISQDHSRDNKRTEAHNIPQEPSDLM